MNTLRYRLLLAALAITVSATAWAGGSEEQGAAAAESATPAAATAMATGDGPRIWATLAVYEADTGNRISSISESPMLAARVSSGDLPPVEERISEEPMVIQPYAEIGRYGGTLRGKSVRPAGDNDIEFMRGQPMLRVSPDLTDLLPNIAKGWEFNADKTSLTLFLRSGTRWSDGAPFTTDDIMFWYEDMILNDKLSPSKPGWMLLDGEIIKATKVDDTTVRFDFSKPYPPMLSVLATLINQPLFAPRHYVSRWHADHNEDADALAKEEGFDNWWSAFLFHNPTRLGARKEAELPVMNTWMLERIDSSNNRYFVRNPYYWKIDTAGNQLPYIDEHIAVFVEDVEVLVLKEIAGEIDYSGTWHRMDNVPLYRENEAAGGFRVLVWRAPRNTHPIILNSLHKDPVLRDIFNDIRFRQALSLSVNRDELNETFFFGLATPRNYHVAPFSSLFEQWMADYFIDYDPDRANGLLDEMGLQWDADREYRLRPDGETLTVIIDHIKRAARDAAVFKEYFEALGIRTIVKEEEPSLINARRRANEHDLVWREKAEINELNMRTRFGGPFAFPTFDTHVPWYQWHVSGGQQGVEPPEEVKELFRLVEEWLTTEPNSNAYVELGKQILEINTRNLWTITALGIEPYPVLFKDTLRNTPEQALWDWPYRFWMPYMPEQWFYSE